MERRVEEFVGSCGIDEQMSEAYKDAIAEFETFGLTGGVDFRIDPDGRFYGEGMEAGKGSEVSYLFKTELLTEKCIEKLRYEYSWFNQLINSN